jgi:hypothetical protein
VRLYNRLSLGEQICDPMRTKSYECARDSSSEILGSSQVYAGECSRPSNPRPLLVPRRYFSILRRISALVCDPILLADGRPCEANREERVIAEKAPADGEVVRAVKLEEERFAG